MSTRDLEHTSTIEAQADRIVLPCCDCDSDSCSHTSTPPPYSDEQTPVQTASATPKSSPLVDKSTPVDEDASKSSPPVDKSTPVNETASVPLPVGPARVPWYKRLFKWLPLSRSSNHSLLPEEYRLSNEYELVLFLQHDAFNPSPIYNLRAKLGEVAGGPRKIEFECSASTLDDCQFMEIVLMVQFLGLGNVDSNICSRLPNPTFQTNLIP